MKKIGISRLLIITGALALMSFALFEQKKTTIWMIGDSTMSIKDPKAYPENGWGMPFSTFFKKNAVVENRAMNGRSTRSFINEKRWDAVHSAIKAGDYLIIEFGHNDEKLNKPTVGTTIAEYKSNLARFVAEARAKKAIPVLMTPIARRHFENGILIETHIGYPEAVRRLADSLNVPMVDMLKKTSDLLRQLGDEGSIKLFNHVPPGTPNYPDGKKDDTHLSVEGAKIVATLAKEGLKSTDKGIAKLFRD